LARGNPGLDDNEEELARQMADADEIVEFTKPNEDNQDFIEDTEGMRSWSSKHS
jgi:hypothetical protein